MQQICTVSIGPTYPIVSIGLPGVRYLIGLSDILALCRYKNYSSIIPDNACINGSIFCATDAGTAIMAVPVAQEARAQNPSFVAS